MNKNNNSTPFVSKFSKEDIENLLTLYKIDTTKSYRFLCDGEYMIMNYVEERELNKFTNLIAKSGYSIYYSEKIK